MRSSGFRPNTPRKLGLLSFAPHSFYLKNDYDPIILSGSKLQSRECGVVFRGKELYYTEPMAVFDVEIVLFWQRSQLEGCYCWVRREGQGPLVVR